ncbi:hypothetical protein PF002_g32412 [Phytophthora fragariae]|uniref:Uncharacterized protein n=1 Tax=Phytophthora fragariae TaxID=53985 RepID=A0A6A3V9J4_9STRA|nr:hypothetical protein PF002_g32412 [Phytophthora fragariae]
MDALDTSPFDTAHSDQGSLATAPPAQTTTPSAGPGRRTRSDENPFPTVDASMRILAALAEQPDLLQHYAQQLGDQERDPKRPRYSSISDLQPTDDSTGRLDRQHSFRPSARQQDVHALTCADDHRVVCTTSCMECVGSPFYIFVASTSASNSTTPTQANSTHATFLLV